MGRTIYKDEDLIGKKFGKLTILSIYLKEVGKTKPEKNRYAHCKCDCGNETDISISDVCRGKRRSCGCDPSQNIKNRIRNIYCAMKQRCYYKNGARYKDYGGRGIVICDEWLHSFKNFEKWALENGYRDDLTIERIDNNGNYCPENCKFASYQIQSSNQRIRKDNSSGYRGVNYSEIHNKWVARVQVNKKRITIGYFKTAEDAHDARVKYLREHKLTQYGEE